MRYRIAVTSAVAALGLGIVGEISGPSWDPVPLTEAIDVTTTDTTIGGSLGTDAVGTYEVTTEIVTVELAGAVVQARISEPVGAEGLRPGVVFVHGAGTGRFDEAFLAQAEALASAGVVALVPDKRLDTYTTRDRSYVAMANDYLRSVDYLRELPDVDPDLVGVYGESEGAWIVPVMAADNPSVAFTVLVAAPVRPPREQVAFAVDSYLRNTEVPPDLFQSVPRLVAMDMPGGGFEWGSFDPQPFQQRMRQPLLIVYGTGDAATPTVQGALQLIDDLTVAGNDQWTVRYYEGANHGIRVNGVLEPTFARDLAAWVQALPGSAEATPRVAGAEPYQRFVAGPLERLPWYADGDVLVASLVTSFLALLLGPVLWVIRRVRGRRSPVLSAGVRAPLVTMGAGAAAAALFTAGYLLLISDMAQNYWKNAFIVQGGWLFVRALAITSVVAGSVLMFRVLDGRRIGGKPAARNQAGAWTLVGTVGGSVALWLVLAYWAVFPTLW